MKLLSAADTIILSLHENAWNMIVSGMKTHEFRRRFRREQTLAFIYVTHPVKEIKGVIFLDKPIEGDAEKIAKIAESSIPGNGKSVYEYFIEKDFGLAIPMRSVRKIKPLRLDYLREKYNFTAPQFYLSLKDRDSLYCELIQAIL
ncbi:hypothetical protein [Photorhabdus laumondii]